MLNYTKEYVCPYCGNTDNLHSFFIKKGGGGYSQKFVKCDNCKERMRLNTLLAEMTLYEWGLWIYLNIRAFNSPNFRFYDKVHFKELFINLELMGKMYKREFLKGFYYGKENWYNEGLKLLDELNKKFDIVKTKRVKTLNNFCE